MKAAIIPVAGLRGLGAGTADFVTGLYQSIYGVAPNAATLAYWVDMIDSARMTTGQVQAWFYANAAGAPAHAPTPISDTAPGGVPASPTPTPLAPGAPAEPSWFDGSTEIFGQTISNKVLAGAAVVAALYFFNRKR